MAEFRQLAKGVYAFLQPPLIWHSSAGVIVGDRDVIVVDSLANAAMTESLRAEIRRVTNKPIRFLINTHSHADHVYTNHLFPEATVISTHFMNGMTPMPGEGQVSQTIANYEALKALDADLYVAGHGDPGTLADVRAQR